MKIDWKAVAASPGYKSMKQVCDDEVKRVAKWGRKPDERYQQAFDFAINRAKHYSHATGVSVESILNAWEENRTYNFMNYYSSSNKPKQHSNILKPLGIRGTYKYFSSKFWMDHNNKRVTRVREITAKLNPRTKKARWSNKRKKDAAYWREKELQRSKTCL